MTAALVPGLTPRVFLGLAAVLTVAQFLAFTDLAAYHPLESAAGVGVAFGLVAAWLGARGGFAGLVVGAAALVSLASSPVVVSEIDALRQDAVHVEPPVRRIEVDLTRSNGVLWTEDPIFRVLASCGYDFPRDVAIVHERSARLADLRTRTSYPLGVLVGTLAAFALVARRSPNQAGRAV